MRLSQAGAAFIATFEGFSATVYRDAVGVETIGYGTTRREVIERHRSTPMTKEQALAELAFDATAFGIAIESAVKVALNQNQYDALVSWTYNVGAGAMRDSTLVRLLNGGDYASVRSQLMRWTKAGGKELPGLKRRRQAEADLFERADDQRTDMPGNIPGQTYGWHEIHRYVRALGVRTADPTPAQSYAGKHSAGSHHYRKSLRGGPGDGCAVDYGDANSDCQAVYEALIPHARPGGPIVELIWQHQIWRNGVLAYYVPNDHLDHTHAAIAPDRQLPGPTTPTKEDPMFIAWEGSLAFLVSERLDRRVWITNAGELDRLVEAGVRHVKGESAGWLSQIPAI